MKSRIAKANQSDPAYVNAKRNLAKVVVKFESLTYEIINEEPEYLSFDLFADIGGIAGKWYYKSIQNDFFIFYF